jgi:hypothetical protein
VISNVKLREELPLTQGPDRKILHIIESLARARLAQCTFHGTILLGENNDLVARDLAIQSIKEENKVVLSIPFKQYPA